LQETKLLNIIEFMNVFQDQISTSIFISQLLNLVFG
jgi:hypothetical protein